MADVPSTSSSDLFEEQRRQRYVAEVFSSMSEMQIAALEQRVNKTPNKSTSVPHPKTGQHVIVRQNDFRRRDQQLEQQAWSDSQSGYKEIYVNTDHSENCETTVVSYVTRRQSQFSHTSDHSQQQLYDGSEVAEGDESHARSTPSPVVSVSPGTNTVTSADSESQLHSGSQPTAFEPRVIHAPYTTRVDGFFRRWLWYQRFLLIAILVLLIATVAVVGVRMSLLTKTAVKEGTRMVSPSCTWRCSKWYLCRVSTLFLAQCPKPNCVCERFAWE